MSKSAFDANAGFLEQEIQWFRQVLDRRFAIRSGQSSQHELTLVLERAPEVPAHGAYADLVRRHLLRPAERLVLILALLPEIAPQELDPFLLHNQAIGRRFTEFGGILGQSHSGFIPTAETALFLLAGDDLAARLAHSTMFAPDHCFTMGDIVVMDHAHPGEPAQAAVLRLSSRYLGRVLTGRDVDPPPSADFPAHRLTSPLEWADLVLDKHTRAEIDDLLTWIGHQHVLMTEWHLQKRLKPGYRSLFYGPPGTGKTLTACLIGKARDLPVYRVDLSMVVSKWIGETEKNLARLFDQAQQRQWILFFDEAESLFGKRTETRSSNDRAANQQVAYLLQRIEDFPGIIILATNLRGNLDEAFVRRFQSVVYFKMPDVGQRLRLWRDMFTNQPFALDPDVDFEAIAKQFELAAGSMINVLRYACLQAVRHDPPVVRSRYIHDGIRAERHKENRSSG